MAIVDRDTLENLSDDFMSMYNDEWALGDALWMKDQVDDIVEIVERFRDILEDAQSIVDRYDAGDDSENLAYELEDLQSDLSLAVSQISNVTYNFDDRVETIVDRMSDQVEEFEKAVMMV